MNPVHKPDITACMARLVNQRGNLPVIRMVRFTEHAQQMPHILHRPLGFLLDGMHGVFGDIRIRSPGIPAAVGLHDDDGQRMRDDIMHIAGDSCALRKGSDTAAFLLSGLQRRIAFPERRDGRVAGTLPVGEEYHGDDAQDGDDKTARE